MSDFIKHIAAMFPAPVNAKKLLPRWGIDAIFPFYHAISNRELPHLKHLYKLRSVDEFAADIDYLLTYFEPVKMSDYLSGSAPNYSDKPQMVLSFDDGLIQCYEEVMPILKSRGVPATFFLNNAFIDNKALFYRFKVSLLIDILEEQDQTQLAKAADLLHCEPQGIKNRLMGVSYVEREITDQIAELWNFSYQDYMRENPVYLTSMHIRKMIDEGFEFGSHGIDHPLFSLLKKENTINHIQVSVEDLKKRYQLPYKYFAFPFTDSGVQDSTIDHLFEKKIIDAGFGTAGLKDDKWKYYFQRIPMELLGKDAKSTLRGEINRRRLRKLTGNNLTKR